MIELTLLGLHAVRGPDGRELGSLPAQPKRFALLAYLAIAGGSGYHRRDTLAAMFWPDLDQFAARRALRNTLYHLREAIGEGAIITKGDEALAIDPDMLTCDVTRLNEAVAEGRFEEAVDLYRGELLAGVHFAKEGEAFEEWLTRERARVVEQVVRAVRALVDRDEKAGDLGAAAYWAQRACTLAPDDESFMRRAMTLHQSAGDRGGALRLYDSYARHLSIQFDTKPSAESAALAARIRAGAEQRVSHSGAKPGVPGAVPAGAPMSEASSELSTESAIETTGVPTGVPTSAPLSEPPLELSAARADTSAFSARRLLPWALALAVAAVAVLMLVRAASTSHVRAAVKDRVLVDVFDNRTGDPKLEALGRMAEDWLSQGLLRTQLVDVVDPRVVFVQSRSADSGAAGTLSLARKTGATFVVTGSYYRTGDSVLFQAAVTDARMGKIVRVVGPIGAGKDSPVTALDDLRSRVMSALASVVASHGAHAMEHGGEIPPFEAYQSYVEGLDASWHGDGHRAERLFLDAARHDAAFSDAAVAAASVASNYSDCAIVDSIAHSFGATSRALDRVQRLTLQIAVARCHGRNDEMLRLTLERADLEPQTSALRISAVAAALWANRPHRALELLQHVNPETDLAWTTDSSHFYYWSGLTEALHLVGDHEAELANVNRMPRSCATHQGMAARTRDGGARAARRNARTRRYRAHSADRDLELHWPRAVHDRTSGVFGDAGVGRRLDRARARRTRRQRDLARGGGARPRVVRGAAGRGARRRGRATRCRLVAGADGFVSPRVNGARDARQRGHHERRLQRQCSAASPPSAATRRSQIPSIDGCASTGAT